MHIQEVHMAAIIIIWVLLDWMISSIAEFIGDIRRSIKDRHNPYCFSYPTKRHITLSPYRRCK